MKIVWVFIQLLGFKSVFLIIVNQCLENQVFKEKKPSRESFVCGACGQVCIFMHCLNPSVVLDVSENVIIVLMDQLGHMRTNKNCPKYGEDPDAQLEPIDVDKTGGKSSSLDPSVQTQQKALSKKLISKGSTKITPVEAPEGEKSSLKTKVLPVKFKCSSSEKLPEKHAIEPTQSSDKPVTSDSETAKSAKVNKILFPKVKPDNMQAESRKHSIAIRPPTDTGRSQVESHHKRSIIIRPPTEIEREQPHKKIIIKRTKEVIDIDRVSPGESTGFEHRKTKRIVELSNFEKHRKQETYSAEKLIKRKAKEDKRWWDEQEKRRNEERLREDRARRLQEEEMRMLKEQEKLASIKRYEEDIRREREEEERQKAKKKKKKKAEFRDEFLDDHRTGRFDDRVVLERDRSGKRRSVVELGRYAAEYMPPTKRRRGGGGEVNLFSLLFKC